VNPAASSRRAKASAGPFAYAAPSSQTARFSTIILALCMLKKMFFEKKANRQETSPRLRLQSLGSKARPWLILSLA
jgi:hypothetical protein